MSRPDERKHELAVAAFEFLRENGFNASSLRDIAQGIGISHRGLLYHFGTKQALLEAVLGQLRIQQRDQLAAATTGALGLAEVLREAWRQHTDPKQFTLFVMFYEVLVGALREPEQHEAFLHGSFSRWHVVADEIAAKFAPDHPHREHWVTLYVATVRGLQLDWLSGGDRQRIESAFEVFLWSLVGALENTSPP